MGGQRPPLRTKGNPKARGRAGWAQHLPYGRGGETKFRRKFFAKLSFKKAGWAATWGRPYGGKDRSGGGGKPPPYMVGGRKGRPYKEEIPEKAGG